MIKPGLTIKSTLAMKKSPIRTLMFICLFTLSIVNNASAENDNIYTLQTGDFLRIMVFGIEDLSGDFTIDSKGYITIPLIGEVHAEGLNKLELKNAITRNLVDNNYYKNPKVTVEIIAMQPFYILGEVTTPGSYEYRPDLNIFKAVAIAGGYTPRASKNKVTIIRKIHGETVKIKATESTPVLPGDSIKVKQRFF